MSVLFVAIGLWSTNRLAPLVVLNAATASELARYSILSGIGWGLGAGLAWGVLTWYALKFIAARRKGPTPPN